MAFRISVLVTALVVGLCLDLSWGHSGHGASQVHESRAHHHCDHGHDHDHDHDHHHHEDHLVSKLPEELAEEEDMKLYGFGFEHDHHHEHIGGTSELSGLGLWVNALGCSFLVSMASLICLIILPVIFVRGKPSKAVVNSLALFGAGAMLGDAFLHQLPHAFGGQHSHSHDHNADHAHHDHLGHDLSHSHSLKDLSVGMSILAGIVLFLVVEKVVRYVEENSRGAHARSHGHHHHHHKSSKILKDDNNSHDIVQSVSLDGKEGKTLEMSSEEKVSGEVSEKSSKENDLTQHEHLRKRSSVAGAREDKADVDFAANNFTEDTDLKEKEPTQSSTNLVFGYLNLFSDGVHNFTDGMALGSAFLLYGSVGGWSRTLFLLAHELPQEVGDFGILVMSGFSVSKALFFNFLSALVALAGTALALLLGQDPGQSSFIEGFTAGGFIYIAVGVLAEMNNKGNSTLKCTAIHLTSLILGMAVALCISLVE
ncbi:IAA-alanine resistance protein 1 [Corylus avellana]|uniref:IAA-alanine resistance protein 1 n=1 Tax=Corylus avellana TaxID=13451 RepID=UPI00286AFE71|nr:IAA-alanine resistance protein 1 [Corylus avellana]